MDPRLKIPALALVGLQFTQGCGPSDPIVGVWSATQIGEQVFPYGYMDEEGYAYERTVELHIGDELRGQFVTRAEENAPNVVAYYEVAQDLTVDADGAPKYRIEVSQAQIDLYDDPYEPEPGTQEDPPLVLECALTADRLRCTAAAGDGSVEMRFKRAE